MVTRMSHVPGKRANRPFEVLELDLSGFATYQDLTRSRRLNGCGAFSTNAAATSIPRVGMTPTGKDQLAPARESRKRFQKQTRRPAQLVPESRFFVEHGRRT